MKNQALSIANKNEKMNQISINSTSSNSTAAYFDLTTSGEGNFDNWVVQLNELCTQLEKEPPQFAVFALTPQTTRRAPWSGPILTKNVNRWERILRRLEKTSTILIAAIDGTILGPALDILLVCDYRIASTDSLVSLTSPGEHVWPGMALYRLVNQVGLGRTKQLILGVAPLTANGALNIGLVDELVESASLNASIERTLIRLSHLSAPEMAIRRQLLLETHATDFEDARGLHLAACDRELRRVSRDSQPRESSQWEGI